MHIVMAGRASWTGLVDKTRSYGSGCAHVRTGVCTERLARRELPRAKQGTPVRRGEKLLQASGVRQCIGIQEPCPLELTVLGDIQCSVDTGGVATVLGQPVENDVVARRSF